MKILPVSSPPSPLRRPRRHGPRAIVCGVLFAFAAAGATAQISVSTLAGTAGAAGTTDETGAAARFRSPVGVAVDLSSGAGAGTVYVADTANHTIRRISPGGIVTTLAGLAGSAGSADGTGNVARFRSPEGVALDGAGAVLYVADTGNSTIRRIAVATGEVATLAGRVGTFSHAEGIGTVAQFNGPTGLGVGPGDTHLFVADIGNQIVRQIALANGAVSTFAGSPNNPGAVNGTGGTARFFLPRAVVADATNLYVVDSGNHTIRVVALGSGAVSTLAGPLNPDTTGATDATGAAARFKSPAAIAVRGANLYVADAGNSTVRQVTIASGATTTLAGAAGATGSTDAVGAAARFATASPQGIAVDAAGNFYATDSVNHTIRKAGPTTAPSIATQPANVSVGIGGTATFTVGATGNPTPTYQWQRQAGGNGAFADLPISPPYDGVTSATLSVAGVSAAMNGDKFRCIVTNTAPGSATTNPATLTVTQAPAFTSASSAIFAVGVPGSFTVVATGSPAPTFAISAGADPAAIGVTLSAAGVLSGTPTGATGSPFAFTITATSAGSGTITQNFILTVQTGAGIATPPADRAVAPGANATFSVVAGGFPATYTYQWQRAAAATPANFSSLGTGDTTYTGTQAATLTVVAATAAMNGDLFRCVVSNGQALPVTSASARLTVTQPPVFTSVASTTFAAGLASTYRLAATGSPAPTFAVTTGTVPAGLTLGTDGLLSGTATATTGSPVALTITATNTVGTATQNFTLTLIATGALPAFTTPPANQTAIVGGAASFTVVATGQPAVSYQWQRQAAGTTGFVNLANGGAYGGVTTATLTITGIGSGLSGDQFLCVATNTAGSTARAPATLTTTLPTIVGTFAGLALTPGATDATGADARFNFPAALAFDRAGNLYVADTINCVIRRITPAGVVTTFAGQPGVFGNTDGPAATARFNGPGGVAVDGAGNVYVADTFSHTIRVITAAGAVTTLAGSPGATGSTDGTGAEARFAYPTGVAVNSAGIVFVADSTNHTIRAVTQGGVVTTYAGVAGARGTADGFAQIGTFAGDARFANPTAVAVDSLGNLYVADTFNHAIRKIAPTANVTTIAGLAGTSGAADGAATTARFNQPSGLAVDAAGTVWVIDTFNHTLRKLTTAANVTTTATLAGSAGVSGSADDASGAARFFQPSGIAVDANGVVFVADTKNSTIRRTLSAAAPAITTQPISRGALPGLNATFTVAATGLPTPSFQWQRQPAGTTGFANLANNANYSGVTTATLTIFSVATAMNGDQFRCVVSNFVSPDATTNVVTLATSLTAPAFTSATRTTFTVGQAGTFTVATTGTPAPTLVATGLPAWAAFNATTGVLSGTPPDATGAPFTVALTANNGLTATQSLALEVLVPAVAPAIFTQPASLTLARGGTAAFTVAATGTAPLTYQWSKNGAPLAGATAATLILGNVQFADLGSYTARVTNSAGSATSSAATLNLTLAPTITAPPRAQVVAAGATATLAVLVTADPAPIYQWRLNGAPIAGATFSTLVLANLPPSATGNYDVVVTNSHGTVTSSLAQLTVATGLAAPVIAAGPADRTVVAGGAVSFALHATGVPAVTYQWRRNGQALPGETHATLALAAARAADTGEYDAVVTNDAGTAISSAARLNVIARSYAGTYFGPLGGSTGGFALHVRADNSAALLAFLPGTGGGSIGSLSFHLNDAGAFSYRSGNTAVSGTVAADGSVSLSATAAISASLAGTRLPDLGAAQAAAGFYSAGVAAASGTAHAIVAANGQIFVLVQTGAQFDGGLGTLDSTGRATIATAAGSLAATVAADGSTFSASAVRGAQTTTFVGASESIVATQRLANLSSRARVDAGANVAIAGFVISGSESKPVLIRAIGPTLAAFGVNSALGGTKLDLFRGSAVIATNTGWATAGNTPAIVAATAQVGGFALAPGTADSVIFATLPPGAYTAQVSAAGSSAAGVALVEVYDLSAAAAGQKLLNLSTRATAGAGESMLIAGLSVGGTVPKRVLIRAIGPGLSQLGLSGVLATPQLQLIKDGTVIAQNTGLATSPDAAAIAAASAQVGAFALPPNSADCALLLNLAPGNYSAAVSSTTTTTGLAIIEVYEVP